jgi:hypothetical protein
LRNAENKGYADFGGKIEPADKNSIDIAVREANEESNNIFSKEYIKSKISMEKCHYIAASKYLLFFLKTDNVDVK